MGELPTMHLDPIINHMQLYKVKRGGAPSVTCLICGIATPSCPAVCFEVVCKLSDYCLPYHMRLANWKSLVWASATITK